jgi:hypothetical protein
MVAKGQLFLMLMLMLGWRCIHYLVYVYIQIFLMHRSYPKPQSAHLLQLHDQNKNENKKCEIEHVRTFPLSCLSYVYMYLCMYVWMSDGVWISVYPCNPTPVVITN